MEKSEIIISTAIWLNNNCDNTRSQYVRGKFSHEKLLGYFEVSAKIVLEKEIIFLNQEKDGNFTVSKTAKYSQILNQYNVGQNAEESIRDNPKYGNEFFQMYQKKLKNLL